MDEEMRDAKRRGVANTFMVALLAALLAGCGTSSATRQKSNMVVDDPLAINYGAAQAVSGLQLRIEAPDSALYGPDPRLGLDCGNHLVLTQSATASASTTAVKAVESYLNTTPLNRFGLPSVGSPTPPELRWVAGVGPYNGPGSTPTPATCFGLFVLSNTSNRTMVVIGGGVLIDAHPIAPTFHYNTLELCGFQLERYYNTCFPGGAQAGGCGYSLDVSVAPSARVGDRQSGDISSDNTTGAAICPTPVAISPGATVKISFSVSASADTAPGIYRVTPYLMTDQGVLDYPDLVSHVVFAADSDFMCYTYHGQAFVPVEPDPITDVYGQGGWLHPSVAIPPYPDYYTPICL